MSPHPMVPLVHHAHAKYGRLAPSIDCRGTNDVHEAFGAFTVGAFQYRCRQVGESGGALVISHAHAQQTQEHQRQCCVLANTVFDGQADGLYGGHQPFGNASILQRTTDDLAQQLHREKVLGIRHERHIQYVLVVVAAEVRLDPYQLLDDRPDDASLRVHAKHGLGS
eukprot:CAMPEP_0119560040 /NCGR_PEP_ID=MMETSP1352-20130426/13858_1 /TAXON_ID=265584 /ORGANISM="Stauroneis constricta, Strain CCMP1120" /LENGTH=166 /DNA_ID=CAMNT_0007607907 /DNA_START=191 /DNA_END=688 /DNA_ORIENTATION=+